MSAKVIAFINFKGGVGKTSNVVNLGSCLAKYHGKKVLLIDLDAQCNSTFWLLKRDQWSHLIKTPTKTVCQIFDDYIYGIESFRIEDVVVKGVPKSNSGFSYIRDLDLLPASPDLLRIEDELHGGPNVKHYYTYLQKALRDKVKDYDFVLIDCPPNIYSITKNALYFADYYIVPYIPDYLSLSGFCIFSTLVRKFHNQIHGPKKAPLTSRIRGLIINRYRKVGSVFDRSINELKLEISELKESGLIHPDAMIFEPYIRDCVKVAECSNVHLPVNIYSERSIGSQDYAELSGNFIEHFKENI